MGRAPCCDKGSVKKGPWSPEEDEKLKEYIRNNGTGGNWIALPTKAGLKRCGKSCRLRWLNYLRPNINHGDFSDEEDRVICTLFATIGSRWSIIAAQLPGRTDNDIKNYWNTKLKKKLQLPIAPHSTQLQYNSRPPAPPPPPFTVEHHHNHTSSTSAASSGQLLMFGVGGNHRQRSSCSSIDISNNNSAVGLESFMFGGSQQQQQQQEGTDNLIPAATAENDIMTSSGLLLLDHHQQYGGGSGSYGHHEMKPPLMISPSSFFFYGDGDGEASAAATQEGTRCGKSCRLRWLNYLRPNINHGDFSDEEDRVICTLFATIGSRWSLIAAQLPGRTDNGMKNYWNTKLKKKQLQLLITPHSTQLEYSSRPPAPPPQPFTVEHHRIHTSSTSAASSGQLPMFGVGGDHRQRSSCSSIEIFNYNSAVGLESFIFGGLQQQQQEEEGTNNLFPAAAAENDIMTSGGLLQLDHHPYGGGGYGHHEMKPPLMISPSSFFFYGDGDGEASAGATQEGMRFLY